ncbi:MAG: NlpC/P60 family protein [Acidimicrobiales bacterium]|nr:NlpC/P60 family protein [Actinomycetota bacterium]
MTVLGAQGQGPLAGVEYAVSSIQSRLETISYEAGKGDFQAALAAAESALELPGGSMSSQSALAGPATLSASGGTPSSAFALLAHGAGSGGALGGSQVVADAMRYLGVPYQWGGTSPKTGFDCSGFVQHVFADLGVPLPRTSEQQAQVGTPVASLAQAVPGDLVFFDPGPSGPGHVGIYIGNGKMVDAPHTGTSVQVQQITSPPCEIRRILSTGGGSNGSSQAAALAGMGVPYGLVPLFVQSATRAGIPPVMLAAVAKAESGFNPMAVSSAGAQGIMQLMPQTAAAHGVSDPFDPAQAVPAAASILAGNLAQFGSVPLALAAYNAGAGAVASYGGIPPYPQTQAYVQRVMGYMGVP